MAPATLNIADGHSYVKGRGQETAAALLEAAERVGMKGAVTTTSFGYIVPDAVFEAYGTPADASDGQDNGQDNDQDKNEGGNPEGENLAVEFDPSEATVQEVNDYLAGADETERARVLAAEKAGKNRSTVNYEEAK